MKNISDDALNGYSASERALKKTSAYITIGWDFDNTWDIKENEGYPFLKDFGQFEYNEIRVSSTFDYTKPESLSPRVTPSQDEDAGVNITGNTFKNGSILISFGLGTRTQSFSARLWTDVNRAYCLRSYQNGTITIASTNNNLIKKITFTGEDVSSLTPDVGYYSNSVWVGESPSVTFTIGATCNKINTIVVEYIYDGLYLSDSEPTILEGTFDEGRIGYTRNSLNGFDSFCLPFDINLSNVGGIDKVYIPLEQMLYNTETGWLMMFLKEKEMNSTIPAGTPFLAKTNGSDVIMNNCNTVNYSKVVDANPELTKLSVYNYDGKDGVVFENSAIEVSWGGTYVATDAVPGMYSFTENATFSQCVGTLNPFRAYIIEKTTSDAAKIKGITINHEETSDIQNISSDKMYQNDVYNLQGQKVLSVKRGNIYIVNGKKVLK